MKTRLASILLTSIILSSAVLAGDLQEPFDFGKVENGQYTNSYFRFAITVPSKWIVQSSEQNKQLMNRGKDLIAGQDQNLKAMLEASDVNSAYLLTVFKYEVGAPAEFNPSFMVIAENLKEFPGIKTGGDYLYHTRKLLLQSQIKYSILDETFKTEQLAGREFYTMNSLMVYGELSIRQKFYSTIINGFSFNIIVSYSKPDEKFELDSVLNSIKFAQDPPAGSK